MYFFELNMLNIKTEALAQECTKKGILKILQYSLKNNCVQESLLK